jgi:ribosome modulation factor
MKLPDTKNRGFIGAFKKGYQARQESKPRVPPYQDKRGGRFDHIVTYSRAFRKYWLDGWDAADKDMPPIGSGE